MPRGNKKLYTETDEKKVRGIGRRVRIIREMKGLTLEEFGKRLGCSKQFISAFESKNTISIGTMVAVCRVLEITPNTLLGYDTELEELLAKIDEAKEKFFKNVFWDDAGGKNE